MRTFMTWTDFSGLMLSLASTLKALEVDRRKQKENIEQAISRAFINTEKYYEFRGHNARQDREREYDLAQDWERAAILIQPIDENLAYRMALKSRFWLDGGTWSDEQIKEAGIQLHRVRAEGMSLFGKKAKRK